VNSVLHCSNVFIDLRPITYFCLSLLNAYRLFRLRTIAGVPLTESTYHVIPWKFRSARLGFIFGDNGCSSPLYIINRMNWWEWGRGYSHPRRIIHTAVRPDVKNTKVIVVF
jgi:hypothetical protein